jgi:hypothetical protein
MLRYTTLPALLVKNAGHHKKPHVRAYGYLKTQLTKHSLHSKTYETEVLKNALLGWGGLNTLFPWAVKFLKS